MKTTTRIAEVIENEGKKALVVLEKNVFHPSGGGQPGDTGLLRSDVFEAEVKDCRDKGGKLLLLLKVKRGKPETGMSVEAQVDLERNHLLSRMHTGEHILSRILEDSHPGLHVQKVAIGEEESTISLTYEGNIDWDVLFEAEKKAMGIILADLPVKIEIIEREKAKAMENLKINWERVEDQEIRVVSIPDFDTIACSGTHVPSTGDVGGILVTGFKGSSPGWAVSFTVHRERFLAEYSYVLRPLLRSVGCPLDKLPDVYESLQQERKRLLKTLEKVRGMLELPWQSAVLGPYKLKYLFLEGLPIEMIIPSAKMQVEEMTIVLALAGRESGKASFVLAKGSGCLPDLRDAVRKCPKLKARGGGAPEWVQGETEEKTEKEWLNALEMLTASNQ